LALEYFDFYYSQLFGQEWTKIRLAMLTGKKATALVNNFADWQNTEKELKKLGALNIFQFSLDAFKRNAEKEAKEVPVKIPSTLKVFAFDNGETSMFPAPKAAFKNLLSNYKI
jgi:hypothetical protein